MDKKYQVFVSSTYVDLREERQQVIQALLELDCIPSGMELFPAADEDQWSLIQNVIDECDYYILIIGGRYGSTSEEGISYTEMEYRYALETGKPIIAFLHKDPSKIEKGKSEADSEGQKKLDAFRELAQKKMCKFWLSAEELGSVVSRSVVNLQRKSPGIGWVRGDVVTDKEASQEILKLNKKIQELNNQLDNARTQAPEGSEVLSQGEEKFDLKISFYTGSGYASRQDWSSNLSITWNELFFAISPAMINEATDLQLLLKANNLCEKQLRDRADENLKGKTVRGVNIDATDFDTIVVQFRALGLIKKSDKNRSVKDTKTYWTLTPYGNEVMTRLRAIPRTSMPGI